MSPLTALRLGRISNLPTVWSNTLAGVALGGGEIWAPATLVLGAGLSLLYVAGMYLNDAFDRDIDAVERPSRPIPAGLVAANTVFAAGIGLMLAGLVFVHLAGTFGPQHAAGSGMLAALALAGAIVFYDWHHKGNPLSPFFMGLCRVLAYATAALTVTGMLTAGLLIAAAVVLGYLIGLTYIAKQESLDRIGSLWPLLFLAAPLAYGVGAVAAGPGSTLVALLLTVLIVWIGVALFFLKRRGKGDVPRAVVSLIAGIAIVDALFLASLGAQLGAATALACFLLTLCLQRWISGT